jgi:enterochelin esterase-like enzyme
VAKLKGQVNTVEIDSPNLKEVRKISIYVPVAPPPKDGYPVIYMADGEAVSGLAPYVEKLIDDGSIAPVLLVGMWTSEWKSDEGHKADRRNSEYLPGPAVDPVAYATHEAFVVKEVMPMVEDRFKASRRAESRMTYGFSSGASWSLSLALKHPELFRQASGFAVAASVSELAIGNAKGMRVYLGAGAYDSRFFKSTSADCSALNQAGADCSFLSIYSGHDPIMWDHGLVWALKAAFPIQGLP